MDDNKLTSSILFHSKYVPDLPLFTFPEPTLQIKKSICLKSANFFKLEITCFSFSSLK